jgi:D-apiose dehydrogenase
MKQLKGVCIGTGYFSQFHYEAWSRLSAVQIVGICDLDVDKARDWTLPFFQNTPPQYNADFRQLLAATQPDFVDIITPPNTHFDLVKTAVDSGIKNIICQKPLAPSFAEAKKMVAYAEKRGVRLMVHENFRFQPFYRELKRLMTEGVIGDTIFSIAHKMRMGDGWQTDAYMARQPYFRTMPRLLIYETGIHFIDVLRFLVGDIASVYARLRKLNPDIAGEDCGQIMMEHSGGVVSTLDMNRYNEPNYDNPRLTFGEMTIEGNGGTMRLYGDGRITIQKLGAVETPHFYHFDIKNFAGDCVFFTQKHFIESLLQKTPFDTEGGDYLKNLVVQEAIYQSAQTNQVVLF